MKILVTGFDPFGGDKINPAIEAVKRLPAEINGAEIIKLSMILLGNWILKNGYFGIVKFCDAVHDELCTEYPKELEPIVTPIITKCMETAAAQLCKSLPIPACGEVSNHWVH